MGLLPHIVDRIKYSVVYDYWLDYRVLQVNSNGKIIENISAKTKRNTWERPNLGFAGHYEIIIYATRLPF